MRRASAPSAHESQLGAYGGLGVHHSARRLASEPLSDVEVSHAAFTDSHAGVSLFARFTGTVMASTRGELLAAITAAQRPCMLHIVTDSLYFASTHRALMDARLDLAAKPWPCRKNGDLWQHWEQMLALRGRHSISVQWVPSHTDEQAVADRRISAEHQAGNRLADAAASRCRGHAHARHIMDPLVSRWLAYRRLVHDVMSMQLLISKSLVSEGSMTDPVVAERPRVGMHVKIALPACPQGEGLSMRRVQLLEHAAPVRAARGAEESVAKYLMSLDWSMAPVGQAGISWAELLCDFELTLAKFVCRPGHDHGAELACVVGGSTANVVRTFAHAVRRVVRLQFDEAHVQWFSPGRAPARLKYVGIKSDVACIKVIPHFDQQRWAAIASHMSKLRRDARAFDPSDVLREDVCAPVVLAAMARPPPWRRQGSCPQCWMKVAEAPRPECYACTCDRCESLLQLPSKPVPVAGVWPTAWCAGCKRTIRFSAARCLRCSASVPRCQCRWVATAGGGSFERGVRTLTALFGR